MSKTVYTFGSGATEDNTPLDFNLHEYVAERVALEGDPIAARLDYIIVLLEMLIKPQFRSGTHYINNEPAIDHRTVARDVVELLQRSTIRSRPS